VLTLTNMRMDVRKGMETKQASGSLSSVRTSGPRIRGTCVYLTRPRSLVPEKWIKKCKKDLVGKVFIGFYLEKPSFHKRWNPYCCLTWLSSCYANVRWQCTLRYSSSFRSPTQLYWMLLEMLIHVHTYIGPQHAFPFNRMDWPGLTCQWIPVHWGRLGPAGLRIPPTGPQLLLYTSTSWYS
jgi:hypothetical protein